MNSNFLNGTLFPLPKKKLHENKDTNGNYKTRPINIYHKRNYDTFIGRGSKWGNPWTHVPSKYAKHVVDTRELAIKEYFQWIQGQPELLAALPEIVGHRLGCYCYPKACHGDILGLLADSVKIGKSILNNKKYYWSFIIDEEQYEIMDERRLEMLAWLTESDYICIKKKGDVSGIRYIAKENNPKIGDKLQFINNEETSFGPGLYLYDVCKPTKEGFSLPEFKLSETHDVVEVVGKDVWYLYSVYSNEIDKDNEILISPKDYGTITQIFANESELDNYILGKRSERIAKK